MTGGAVLVRFALSPAETTLMPKMKTNRSIAKRFKVTKSGKVRRFHANSSHLLSGKKSSRRRKLRKSGLIKGRQAITYRRMLGG